MRAFVAIDLAPGIVESLVGFQSELSRTGADLKLVERENLHFTLKFLGEITDSQAAEARSRLGGLRLAPAKVELRGAGAFPNPRKPRVVWAGVAPEHERSIAPIAREVMGSLAPIGERDDRPFQAHITLARVRSLRNSGELAEVLRRNSGRSFGTAELNEFKLKSSVLTQGGPIYSDLGVFPLR